MCRSVKYPLLFDRIPPSPGFRVQRIGRLTITPHFLAGTLEGWH